MSRQIPLAKALTVEEGHARQVHRLVADAIGRRAEGQLGGETTGGGGGRCLGLTGQVGDILGSAADRVERGAEIDAEQPIGEVGVAAGGEIGPVLLTHSHSSSSRTLSCTLWKAWVIGSSLRNRTRQSRLKRRAVSSGLGTTQNGVWVPSRR